MQQARINSGDKHWYALYTKSRNEKKVHHLLDIAGYEVYLPLKKTLKNWIDRKKWVEEPLLSSYVFVRLFEHEFLDILKLSGTVRFIMFGGKIAAIPDWQIQSLQILLKDSHEFNIINEHLQPGMPVEVIAGVLQGMRGEIVDIQGKKKIVLRIESLQFSLEVKVDINLVQALPI
jgi:transcriptional antiterminator RfaH